MEKKNWSKIFILKKKKKKKRSRVRASRATRETFQGGNETSSQPVFWRSSSVPSFSVKNWTRKNQPKSPRWDLNETSFRPAREKYMQMSGPRSPFRDRSAQANKVVTQTVDHQRVAGFVLRSGSSYSTTEQKFNWPLSPCCWSLNILSPRLLHRRCGSLLDGSSVSFSTDKTHKTKPKRKEKISSFRTKELFMSQPHTS